MRILLLPDGGNGAMKHGNGRLKPLLECIAV
jgi:hypothetical protein